MTTFPMQFAPPPRHVPASLRVVNFFNGVAQIGWFVFGFGMIFFWVFALNGDYSFLTFRGPFERAAGKVTSVEATGASENKQPVRRHHYEYSVAGSVFRGTSYATGREVPQGDAVTVEYDAGNPERSRIEGMRRSMFGPAVLLVVIFPLVGFVVLVPSMLMGRKRNRLLRDGVFTTGVLKSKRATNMTVNKRRVFALTFEFTGRDGRRHEVEARSNNPSRLEDEAQEPLLYDPNDPTKAYILDEAPARPKIEMNGDLVGRPAAAIASLIIPTLVIAVHTFILLFKFDML